MPDIDIGKLSRDQIHQLDQVLEIFHEPPTVEDCGSIIQVIETARLWYLQRSQALRMEERGA